MGSRPEKGTVENRNRAVRRYVPKKTNLSTVSGERLKEIETILRTRYMKVLDFKTPQEAWDIAIEREKKYAKQKSKRATMGALPTSIIQKAGVRLEGFF